MQKKFLKFRKVLPSISCFPLILISNNLELTAKYLPNDLEESITTLEIKNIKSSFKEFDSNQNKNLFIAENKKNITLERISDVNFQEKQTPSINIGVAEIKSFDKVLREVCQSGIDSICSFI